MKVIPTAIPDVLLIEPAVYSDNRGYFFESFNQRQFEETIGRKVNFVQDNHSHSVKGVLRGLHYQLRQPQGKLVRVIRGEILDVAVDVRRSSPTFSKWVAELLSAENVRQMWIPEGFAHGFLVLSETADVLYKVTDYYAPNDERCIVWNDKDIAIDWKIATAPLLSQKDLKGAKLTELELFP